MTFRPGTLRGLRQCASPRGTFTVLALDHRQNLRRELRLADPASVTFEEMVEFKRAVVRALAGAATGVLLDPEIGAAQCIADGARPAAGGAPPGGGGGGGGVGGKAARLLPPPGRQRARPGGARGLRRGGGARQRPAALPGAAGLLDRGWREADRP